MWSSKISTEISITNTGDHAEAPTCKPVPVVFPLTAPQWNILKRTKQWNCITATWEATLDICVLTQRRVDSHTTSMPSPLATSVSAWTAPDVPLPSQSSWDNPPGSSSMSGMVLITQYTGESLPLGLGWDETSSPPENSEEYEEEELEEGEEDPAGELRPLSGVTAALLFRLLAFGVFRRLCGFLAMFFMISLVTSTVSKRTMFTFRKPSTSFLYLWRKQNIFTLITK